MFCRRPLIMLALQTKDLFKNTRAMYRNSGVFKTQSDIYYGFFD